MGRRSQLVQIAWTLCSYVLHCIAWTQLTTSLEVCLRGLLCSLRPREDAIETGDAVRSKCDRSDCESLPTLR
jgi:hypothetical protein